MNKILLVSLVLLGSCFHFTPAFPAPLEDSNQMDPKNPREATSTDDLTTVDKEKRIKFGTALGHAVDKSDGDNFVSDWRNAYNRLYNGNERRDLMKRVRFGTALGHAVDKSDGDNFVSDWRNAYNRLYNGNERRGLMKRVRFGTALGHNTNKDDFKKDWSKKFKSLYPDADKRGVGYGTALGHGVGGNDDSAAAMEKMYQELYGKRNTLE